MTSRTFTSSRYGIDVTIFSSGCPHVAITAVAFRAVEGCAERRLRHLVDVNGFFSALAADSRKRADCDLSLWWSECHDTEQFDRIAQPDDLGVSEEAGVRAADCGDPGVPAPGGRGGATSRRGFGVQTLKDAGCDGERRAPGRGSQQRSSRVGP